MLEGILIGVLATLFIEAILLFLFLVWLLVQPILYWNNRTESDMEKLEETQDGSKQGHTSNQV